MSKVNQQDIDIATVSHCITRLRFVLNNPAIAKPKDIEQLRMVKGCFTNAGQFQVVIGTEVGDYYNALLATTGQASADKEQAKKAARQNMKWHEQLISHFAEIFFPLLPALISGGLILGFRNVIGDLPMSNGQTLAQMHPSLKTLYDFLWLIGEAIFFYLPVDWRRAVRLPVRAAGDYRGPSDHARHRYADDSKHGRYAGLAADRAVQHRPGVGGGGNHHRQP